MTGDRKLSQILAIVAVLAASPAALGQVPTALEQVQARVGPPSADPIRVMAPKTERQSRPEGSPIPGLNVLETPQQNDFTTPDGFTHFHLDVNSGCSFANHNYTLNIPLDPARLSQISYLMTNYDVDYNDPQGCELGPEVDLMKFNNNSLGILTGANDSWSINKWPLTRAKMVNGSNAIFIDTDSTGTGCWCVGVGYLEVIAKVDFKVKEFKPADNDKNRDFHASKVDINTTFTLEYDTATLTASTFKVEYRNAAGAWTQVAGTFTQLAPEKFRFTPSADLKDGIRYRATVVSGASGVKAKAGGAELNADKVWYFWTVPDLSVNDAFDYGGGTTCPPSANPCPGLEVNVFQVARDKKMVPSKKAVARIYHRWKRHTDVLPADQVKQLEVKDDLGTFGKLQKTVKRPDGYTAAEKIAAGNTVNIFHTPAAAFSYSLESTPMPQTNATLVKYTATRTLTSTGSSPRMKYNYYFLKDGAWAGGVPAGAKTAGRALMTTGSLLITDQFPVLGTTYTEKGTHSIGYTMTGTTVADAVCGTINQVNCPGAGKTLEYQCAQQKMETMRGGRKFVAGTASNTLCNGATGFALGNVFFHMYPGAANDGTIAHEVGHIYGISTANTPTNAHRNASNGVEGFQIRSKKNKSFVENPTKSISLMHTTVQPVGTQWIDNSDYDTLIAAGITSAPQPLDDNAPEATEAAGQYLIVSGYADLGAASLTSVFLQEVPNDAPNPSGTHTVELLDASNGVLASAGVSPGLEVVLERTPGLERGRTIATPTALTPYFSVSLPWSASAQKIRVRMGASILATFNRTAISPTVSITAPGDGATLSGTVPVSWTGLDGDSPLLSYQLQLSNDSGATWTPLIPLTDVTSFSLDTTLLASGPSQLLRVMVTDGFNTNYATRTVNIVNPLAVKSVDPPDTATGVGADSTVAVAFGTDVNTSTLFAGFKMVVQGTTTGLGGSLTYDPVVQTVVYTPASTLLDNTTYVVTLTGVQDVNGNALATYQWSFTTGADVVAPLVTWRGPGDGDLNVQLNPLVVAQFSEDMNPSTVTGANFQVTGPGGPVAGTVTYNSLVGQAVFTPSAAFAPNTTYTALVTAAVQDAAGNALPGAESWSFTTGTLLNPSGARLLDSYADEAFDNNGDGLFDELLIYIDVEVKADSIYNINGRLMDKNGQLIEWQSGGFYDLPPGAYTLGIFFTGSVIRSNGVDGPFTLDSLNFYDYFNLASSDTRFDAYQTFPYSIGSFFSVMTLSGLPDQVLEKGTTRNNAFNLRDYSTHLTQPVSSLTYTVFINSNPDVGVSIDGSANIDINPAPTVEAESDVTIEAKDTLGNRALSTFHISVQAAAPNSLTATAPAAMPRNGNQNVTVDIYDQFARLFTQSATVTFQSTFGTFTPPSVLTSTGHATSSFSPGGAVGTAFITATSGTATTQFSIESRFAAGDINASGLLVDPVANAGLSDGNNVLEAGERVFVRPSWNNATGGSVSLLGTASLLTGPAGATYTLDDPTADYGSVGAGATNNCATATGNCYEMTVSNPLTRPLTHWDAEFTETLPGVDPPTVRKLHVGQSFTDVPKSHTFYQFVERILHKGVTTGCTGTTYCPDDTVFRLQMAIFIARSQAGSDAAVPVSGTAQGNPYNCVAGGQSQFTDIDPTNPFCRHVHYLFKTGVTTGCITTPPRQYCPGDNVSRGQMALFIGRAVAGSDAAVPLTYGPDPVTGRSYSCNAGTPNLHFTDIATSDIYCRHTHYLWAKDVISGFPDGSFGPALPVTRGAMSKFLANGFNLKLYGP